MATFRISQLGDFGFGATLVINLLEVLSVVERQHAAVVTSIAFLSRSVGSTLGRYVCFGLVSEHVAITLRSRASRF